MSLAPKHSNILKKLGLTTLTILLITAGSFFQQRVLQVNAAVQVLLVSRSAIAFGEVFPGQHPTETYNVQLDTSASSSTYVTTLDPIPGLQNLCPFLNLHSIDAPSELDTLPNSTLTKPGDVLDKWQVQFNAPGIQGQLSQDHNGGIIVQGGNFGCKITITTDSDPGSGKIIICKKSVGGTGAFSYTGALGGFAIQTATTTTQGDPCGGTADPCSTGNVNQTAGSGSVIVNTTKCIVNTTVTNSNSSTVTNNVTSVSSSGGVVVTTGSGDISNTNIVTGNSFTDAFVNNSVNIINSTVTFGSQNKNGSGNKVFDNLAPGNYNITEASTTGWTLSGLSCVDPTGNTVLTTNGANINLSANETVVCTFTNSKPTTGTIIIQKKTIGGDGKFNFSCSLGSFNLQTASSTASQTFSNVKAGSYVVSEVAQPGWTLSGLSCTDPTHDTITSSNSATIRLAAGETVTCVYTNTKKPK